MAPSEFEVKQDRIADLLQENRLDALLLRRVSNFAWATCGASGYVNTATTAGAASLLITPSARSLLTTNIEAPRFESEEHLAQQGWQFEIHPWFQMDDHVARLTKGLRLGTDMASSGAADLEDKLARLRANLTAQEGDRMRALCRLSAEAMDQAIRSVRPGDTEYAIAAKLAAPVWEGGAVPIVNLVATDDRVYHFRHPLPTERKLERYAMLVLCARKWGLVSSITRLVYFGQLPDELRRKEQATADVDATFIAATRPGAHLSDIFSQGVATYASTGFPDEWKLHHQGGAAGYEPREYLGTPDSADVVQEGQSFAWNPSITGYKSEDTILVGAQSNTVLTEIPGFPTVEARAGRVTIKRPAVLEIT